MKQNPILLNFKDKAVEQEFKRFYELETRVYIRVGIILSIFAWASSIFLVYFTIPDEILFYSVVILSVFPFFSFIIYATYNDRFIGHYQWMAAVANGLAGLLAIYALRIFPYSEHSILLTLLIIIFFAFYMLRLRLIYAIPPSLVYMVMYQSYIISFSDLDSFHITFLSFITWLTVVCAVFAGYISELTNRKIFIQQKIIEEQKERITTEYERAENLLLNILPPSIAQRLKENEAIIADSYTTSSVLFDDIVGFTQMSENLPPDDLVRLLNQIFSMFDDLVEKYDLEKIKTIGDAYMVAGGLPVPTNNHIEAIADLSLEMQNELDRFNVENDQTLDIRIGIHIGPTVAGVIGNKKFIYDVWGDTVNTASRMESHGIAGLIQVSEKAYELLNDKYLFKKRGIIDIKGKGAMRTYLLQGKR